MRTILHLLRLLICVAMLSGDVYAHDRHSPCQPDSAQRMAYLQAVARAISGGRVRPVDYNQPASDINDLRQILAALVQDQSLPANIRNLIENALRRPGINIEILTQELRLQIESSAHAVASMRYQEDDIRQKGVGPRPDRYLTFPRQIREDQIGPGGIRGQRHLVAIDPERSHATSSPAASVLLHEIAHSRFITFLDRNFQRIARQMPRWMISHINGRYYIEQNALLYLNERYAHEAEFIAITQGPESLRSAGRQMLLNMGLTPEMTLEEARPIIARFVREQYQLSDPRFAQLDRQPLQRILRTFPRHRMYW